MNTSTLTPLIPLSAVSVSVGASTQQALIREVAGLLMKADATLDPNQLVEAFERRELVQSTAVIEGVAFPQATLPNLQAPMIAIARSEQGVPFNSLDGTDTFLFVALLTPEEDPKRSLHLLARLTRLFHSQPQLRDELCVARSPERLLELFGAAEALL